MTELLDEFSKRFYYNDIQDLMEEGRFRRYDYHDHLKSNKNNSFLIKSAWDIFKNNKSFDGYPVYKIVLQFNYAPLTKRGLYCLDVYLDKDYLKMSSYVETLIDCIDRMGLFLELGVVWTYPSKQHARNKLNSWRNQVLKDNTCACCGGDKHLEAHHIFGFADYEELRDDPNNGIVLCKWCHKKYHSYYPGEATPKNLIEFFKRFGGRDE